MSPHLPGPVSAESDKEAMKSVLLAMSEEDHDKRSWRCTALVAVFVLLTLAVNATSREQAALIKDIYAEPSESVLVIFLAAVAVAQLVLLVAFLHPSTTRGELPCKEALAIVALGHVGGTFLRDFQRSFSNPEMSLAVTLAAPLLALVAILTVTSTMPRLNTWVSTMIISIGCIFMVLHPTSVTFIDRASLISSLSVFSFILRNIVIKYLVTTENISIKPRGSIINFSAIGACFLILCAVYILGSAKWVLPTFCAIVTSWLSAIMFYLNSHLLKTYNVVFVSLFQVWGLLIEGLIVTSSQHRPDIIIGICSFAIVLLGHYLFFKDHMEHGICAGKPLSLTISKANNTHEQYTRVEFLLFFNLVVGIVFYVFQPKVSQRDLDTLSYVGLDKVFQSKDV